MVRLPPEKSRSELLGVAGGLTGQSVAETCDKRIWHVLMKAFFDDLLQPRFEIERVNATVAVVEMGADPVTGHSVQLGVEI